MNRVLRPDAHIGGLARHSATSLAILLAMAGSVAAEPAADAKLRPEQAPGSGSETVATNDGTPANLHEPLFDVRLNTPSEPDTERLRSAGEHSIGSGDDNTIWNLALAEVHARLTLAPDESHAIEPVDGPVFVNGARIEEQTIFGPDDDVRLSRYRLAITRLVGLDPAEAVARAVDGRKEEFEDRAYRFCHDESFGKNDPRAVTKLCALLDEASADACPAVVKSCPWNRKSADSWLPDIPIPVAVLRILFFALLAMVVVVFIVSILRAGWDDSGYTPEGFDDDSTIDLQQLPDTRSAVLWQRAQDAYNARAPEKAALLSHLAILRYLDDSGLARYHPSKTNGDYARAIRGHKPLQRVFRKISGQTERLRFGDGTVAPDVVAAVLKEGPDLIKRPVGELAVAPGPPPSAGSAGSGPAMALVLAGLAGTVSGCVEWPGHPYHAHAPEGMAALPALLERAGLEVEIGRWKWADVSPDTGVLVLRTSAAANAKWPSTLRLDDQLVERPIVIIDDTFESARMLFDTRRRPFSLEGRAQAMSVPTSPATCVPRALLAAPIKPVTMLDEGALEVLDADRIVTSSVSDFAFEMSPMVGEVKTATTGGAALLWGARPNTESPSSCVYIFVGRTLLTNASLTRPENAAFVAAFFASVAGARKKVALFDRLDGWMTKDAPGDNAGAGRAFAASNMLPFLVQTLLSLLLVMFAVGAAFGPLRDPVVRTHKAFVEHVEALGRHYARAGRRGLSHSAQALSKLVIARNRERVRSGTAGGWRALAQDLAEKHDLPEEDIVAALRLGTEGTTELGTPTPSDPPPHSDRILRTLSRLLSGRDAHRHLAEKKTSFRDRQSGDR